jgi:hypothetical protein
VSTCVLCLLPMPCSCVTCPQCGELCADPENMGHVCENCGWREDRCATCGELMTFAADYRGTTVGGLALVGARACVPCGVYEVCRKSKPADAIDWTVNKGGRSLDAGGVRVRAERGLPGQVEALMERLVKLPQLELENARQRELLYRRGVTALRPMSEAPTTGPVVEVLAATSDRAGCKGWMIVHYAVGGGEDQPPFRGWFYWNGYSFCQVEASKLLGWIPLPEVK